MIFFHKLYITLFLPIMFLFKYYFKKICFHLPQNVIWTMTDEITRSKYHNRRKWGNFGPSYRFCEHADLSFLFYFSKKCLVGNIHGKFQKNLLTTFISEESPFPNATGHRSTVSSTLFYFDRLVT